MAERIPIVLSLSDAAAEMSDLSDEAVLHVVFGERGWDASVITPLQQIQDGSTDELCLSGISGPFVLLARTGFATAIEHLDRLQIFGAVRSVLEDREPVVVGNAVRSIYFFQLSDRVWFEKILQKIRELQSSIHTKVFALQLPITGRSPIQHEQNQHSSNHALNIESMNGPTYSEEAQGRMRNDAELDKLLDELDESNI